MARIFSLFALLVAPATASNMEWKNLFVSDCQAGLHFLPNTPLEMNMNGQAIKMAVNVFENSVKVMAKKACPSMSDDDFLDWMMPNIQLGLKHTMTTADRESNRAAFETKCPLLVKGGFDHVAGLYENGVAKTNSDVADEVRNLLPSTCTYDRFKNGNGCGVSFSLPSLGIEIQSIAAKCGGSIIPYGKIQCRGEGCVDLAKPCDVDADCGGTLNTKVVCAPVQKENDFSTSDMFDAMANTDMFMKESDKTTYATKKESFCSQVFPGGEGALGMITDIKTWFKKTWYFDNKAAEPKGSEFKMCVWKGAFEGDADTMLGDRFNETSGVFSSFESDVEENKKKYGGSPLAPFNNAAQKLDGHGFSTPLIATIDSHALTMVYGNCLGEYGFSLFNPRVGGAISMPSMPLGFAKFVDYMQKGQECRADMYETVRLTLGQFRSSWEAHHLNRPLMQLSFDAKNGDSSVTTPVAMHGPFDFLFSEAASRRLLGRPTNTVSPAVTDFVRRATELLVNTAHRHLSEDDAGDSGSETASCSDEPLGWASSSGGTCNQYSTSSWCTTDGGYGSGWDESSMGTFQRWAVDNIDATQACCACGGGTTSSSSSSSSGSETVSVSSGSATADEPTEAEDSMIQTIGRLTNHLGIQMPKTCNYRSYKDHGQCRAKYTGIEKFVGSDQVFHVSVARCSSDDVSEGNPAGAFGLSGSFIDAVKEPTPCGSCGANLKCQNLWALNDMEGAALMTSAAEANITTAYNNMFGYLVFGGTPEHPDGCLGETAGRDITRCEYLGDNGESVFTTAAMKSDIRSVLLALAGKVHDDSSDLSFCIPDYETMVDNAKAKLQAADGSDETDFTWLIDNLAPRVNGETVMDVIEKMTCDGCKPEDHLPSATNYWKIDFPGLEKDGVMKFPGEEVPNGVNIKFNFPNPKLSSCTEFNFIEQAAFKSAIASSVSTDDFPIDPSFVFVVCADARRLLQDDHGGRQLATGVILATEIRSISPEASPVITAEVNKIASGDATATAELATALTEAKMAYIDTPPECPDTYSYDSYEECSALNVNATTSVTLTDGACPLTSDSSVTTRCMCGSACSAGRGCDAIPYDCAGATADCALVTELKGECATLSSDFEAEVAKVESSTPTASEIKFENVRVESNGVANLNTEDDSGGLGAGAIAGIVIGCLALVGLVVGAVIVGVQQQKKHAVASPPVKTVVSTDNRNSITNPMPTSKSGTEEDYADEM